MTIVEPYPSIIPIPPSPTSGVRESISMWATVGAAMRSGRRPGVIEVLFPRTLPVLTHADLTPYHIIEADGHRTLRKGAPPKVVAEAAADYAAGRSTLNEMLDRIGVPN